MGKRNGFSCFGVGILLILLLTGCGGGSDNNQGRVEIRSGDALNPQVTPLARRRRIGGTVLKILLDGDNRPDRPVPVPEMIDSFATTAGNHLLEYRLDNKRGQAIARGREMETVLLGRLLVTNLSFAPPVCGAMTDITCQTPAVVTPAVVAADAESEQCVTINEEMSPVNGLRICIPPGVLEADTTVEVVEVYNITSGVPDHLSQAGVIIDIRFDPEPFLAQPMTLQFPYDEELVATGQQSLGLNEADLSLFQLNRRAGQWVPLPEQSAPNTDANTITAQSSELGLFVVGGPRLDAGNPPVVNDQIVSTFVNTSVRITLTGSDADRSPLMFRVVTRPDRGEFLPTTNLFVEEDGVLIVPEGTSLIYTPELNFSGRDFFLFEATEVSDSRLSSIVAAATVLVNSRQSVSACVVADLAPEDACLGASPVAVAVTDLNGDLIPDLLTANQESHDISVLLGQPDMTFADPLRFRVGFAPAALAVADFNRDAIPDVVTVNTVSQSVSVLLGQPPSGAAFTFAVQAAFAVGGAPSDVAVADIDRNGQLDLVTANFGTSDVTVLFGQGDGTFGNRQDFPLVEDTNPVAVAVADVNGDDLPDILAAHSPNNVLILLGQDGGMFQLENSLNVIVGEDPESLAVADLNADTVPDLVTANFGSDDVSVVLGDGGGMFGMEQRFLVGRRPRDVAVADVNADNSLDLVIANSGTDNVSVLFGQGDGTFQAEQGFGVGDSPSALAVADLNLDGNPDLVTADLFANTVSGLFGNGEGVFPVAQGVGVGPLPQALAVGDLNRDERPDLVTANAGSDHLSVLFGQGDGTIAAAQQAPLSMAQPTDAFGPRDVVISDLENGDTVLDIVTANAGLEENPSTTVSVLLGQGGGAFTAESTNLGTRQGAVAVGDLDGDTLPDLVTASLGTDDAPSNLLFVLLGQGQGTFRVDLPTIQVATGPQDVALGDFNGDGLLDVVTANANSNNVSMVLGRGDGTFVEAVPRDIAVGRRPVAVAVADLDDNDTLDLAVANVDDHNVSILLGQGDGAFVPADPPEFPVGIRPVDVAVADLSGMLEGGCAPGLYVVTANASSNNVAVLRVQNIEGNVTLAKPQFFLAGSRPSSVRVEDFNIDGRPDLMVANAESDNVSVLLQGESEDGACVFAP